MVHTNRQYVRTVERKDGEHLHYEDSALPSLGSDLMRHQLTGPLEEKSIFKSGAWRKVFGSLCQSRRLQSEARTIPRRSRGATFGW